MFAKIVFLTLLTISLLSFSEPNPLDSATSISKNDGSIEEQADELAEKIQTETGRISAFSMINTVAQRHGFEVWLEGAGVVNLVRFLYVKPETDTKFPGLSDIFLMNEEIHLVVRGSEFHRQLVNDIITKFYPRQDEETHKNLWHLRTETPANKPSGKFRTKSPTEIQRLTELDQVLRISEGAKPRVSKSFVRFFVANENDPGQKITFSKVRNTLLNIKYSLESKASRKGFNAKDTGTIKEVFARTDIQAILPHELVEIHKIMLEINILAGRPEHKGKRLEFKYLGYDEIFAYVEDKVLNGSLLFKYDYSKIQAKVRLAEEQAASVLSRLKMDPGMECKRFYK